MDVVAGLDHLNRHVVVINTRSFRVDAGKAGPVGAAHVVIVVVTVARAGAFAAVSTVVALANKQQPTNHRSPDEHGTTVKGKNRLGEKLEYHVSCGRRSMPQGGGG